MANGLSIFKNSSSRQPVPDIRPSLSVPSIPPAPPPPSGTSGIRGLPVIWRGGILGVLINGRGTGKVAAPFPIRRYLFAEQRYESGAEAHNREVLEKLAGRHTKISPNALRASGENNSGPGDGQKKRAPKDPEQAERIRQAVTTMQRLRPAPGEKESAAYKRAADQLYADLHRLAESRAGRRNASDFEDRVQDRLMRYLELIPKWHPDRGASFSTFAEKYGGKRSYAELARRAGPVKGPRRNQFDRVLLAERRRLGPHDTPEKLAENLDAPVEKIRERLQHLSPGTVPMDAPRGHDDDRTGHDFLADEAAASAESRFDGKQAAMLLSPSVIGAYVADMNKRQAAIVRNRLLEPDRDQRKKLRALATEEYGPPLTRQGVWLQEVSLREHVHLFLAFIRGERSTHFVRALRAVYRDPVLLDERLRAAGKDPTTVLRWWIGRERPARTDEIRTVLAPLATPAQLASLMAALCQDLESPKNKIIFPKLSSERTCFQRQYADADPKLEQPLRVLHERIRQIVAGLDVLPKGWENTLLYFFLLKGNLPSTRRRPSQLMRLCSQARNFFRGQGVAEEEISGLIGKVLALIPTLPQQAEPRERVLTVSPSPPDLLGTSRDLSPTHSAKFRDLLLSDPLFARAVSELRGLLIAHWPSGRDPLMERIPYVSILRYFKIYEIWLWKDSPDDPDEMTEKFNTALRAFFAATGVSRELYEGNLAYVVGQHNR